MTQAVPPSPTMGMRPHRGTMILVFGIIGLVCCGIFAFIAWIMGDTDLKAMARGEMDPAGEGLTKAGKICGMIGVALWVIGVGIQIILMVMGVGFGIAGSQAGP